MSSQTFLKQRQTFNFMRDSGNKIYTLRDAYNYKHISMTIDLLSKVQGSYILKKPVIIIIDMQAMSSQNRTRADSSFLYNISTL